MSSYVNLFLKTELTCIPRLLHKYVGFYYNNALCNGATWLFVLWCCLHLLFDIFLKAFLKKARYKDYVCDRLVHSLWYLGYYGTALFYCGATIFQNDMELFNFKKMHVPSSQNLPTPIVIGYTMIATFYLHSAFWEGVRYGRKYDVLSYLFLAMFLAISYILRIVEISFTLTSLIAIAQILTEIVRIAVILSQPSTFLVHTILTTLIVISVVTYATIYLFLIPVSFIIPMGLKIVSDYPDVLLRLLMLVNVLWVFADAYNSPLCKLIYHWIFHNGVSEKRCSIVDCTLFEPRDDMAYNLEQIRSDIKAKEAEMMSLRKPKNKNMLIQTLKCMVAIKRKLSEKRLAESASDSDDSEKSEDSDGQITEKDSEQEGNDSDDEESSTDDEEAQLAEEKPQGSVEGSVES